MLKLATGSISLINFRNSLINSKKFIIKNVSKNNLFTKPINNCQKTNKKNVKLSKIFFILTGGGIFQIIQLNNKKILCQPRKNSLSISLDELNKNEIFKWHVLWKYLRPQIWYFIIAIAGALIVAILNIKIPQVMGGIINVIVKFSENKNSELFLKEMKFPALKLISLYIIQSLSTFLYIFMLSNMGESMSYEIKTDLFANILRQDIAFFDQHRTGELVNRLTTDVQDFKSSFKQVISGGLRAGTQIVGSTISLFFISPHMTCVTLLCIPTIIAIGTAFGAILRNSSKTAQKQNEKAAAVANEAISNIRTVRAFAMEDQEQELYEYESELAKNLNIKLGFGIGWFQAGTNIFLNGMVLGTLYMGGYLLSTDKLTAGELMAYLMATQTVQRSLAQISILFGPLIRGVSAGARIFEYLELQPSMPLKGGNIIPDTKLKGNINFDNVTFAYPTRPQQEVLKNFNLKIPAGKTIAIVGASGNGKSTVVALLERFYDVQNGFITIDDHDIRSLDPTWLRSKALGFISQEPILFGTTVMENIRYGLPTASDNDVKIAAQQANAHEFITNFPDGYNTMVGERGATLSGGQKQRIAIARALLKNPSILLLDEATSALDTESEKIVQSALEKARKGRTVIVIAHRLSTIQNADLIVVLNKGQIVEMGTHKSLSDQKGYYWSLTFQQQEAPAA